MEFCRVENERHAIFNSGSNYGPTFGRGDLFLYGSNFYDESYCYVSRLFNYIFKPKAEVLFEYVAETDDDISLTPGTLVTILEKNHDIGWWKGKNEQGKEGLFPSTYVKEIKQIGIQLDTAYKESIRETSNSFSVEEYEIFQIMKD
ncbi:nostrin isoform X1 [Rhizophagus clarus]|uniref:Nostrin isoform X1 n=1 Tax=Rhizophagus clarus TaxID=94130 RepID=A0A8H3R3Z4_9GLOM|nr:nostrin isoform X1 [Rhizophagus clarus]